MQRRRTGRATKRQPLPTSWPLLPSIEVEAIRDALQWRSCSAVGEGECTAEETHCSRRTSRSTRVNYVLAGKVRLDGCCFGAADTVLTSKASLRCGTNLPFP